LRGFGRGWPHKHRKDEFEDSFSDLSKVRADPVDCGVTDTFKSFQVPTDGLEGVSCSWSFESSDQNRRKVLQWFFDHFFDQKLSHVEFESEGNSFVVEYC
jgi:hypothetical protein